MSQSTSRRVPRGLHAAIIMDGNGRWATARGLPRLAGHRAGADTVRRVLEACPDLGITTLTLYAFSADNWQRPATEVRGLMRLLGEYLKLETPNCIRKGVRLRAIGRRDRMPASLCASLAAAERATSKGRTVELRLALDYSSRDVIARAAQLMSDGPEASRDVTRDGLEHWIGEAMQADRGVIDVDLLIRTGGEKRLSDFLLWESAYAELFFSDTMWPDFGVEELAGIVTAFHRRERRFGGLSEKAG